MQTTKTVSVFRRCVEGIEHHVVRHLVGSGLAGAEMCIHSPVIAIHVLFCLNHRHILIVRNGGVGIQVQIAGDNAAECQNN